MTTAAGIVVRETLRTGLKMFALWNRQDFSEIFGYDAWESELGDDKAIRRHVAKGKLVPIQAPSNGAFDFEIRVGSPDSPTQLTPAEHRSVIDSSETYRFRSLGGLNLSSIEAIGAEVGNDVARVRMVPGDYKVTVHRLGGASFVVLVNTEEAS
jgi:hypothetical protein